MTSEDWRRIVYPMLAHMPGAGGPSGFDDLTLPEVLGLREDLIRDLRRRAAAIGRGRKR